MALHQVMQGSGAPQTSDIAARPAAARESVAEQMQSAMVSSGTDAGEQVTQQMLSESVSLESHWCSNFCQLHSANAQ